MTYKEQILENRRVIAKIINEAIRLIDLNEDLNVVSDEDFLLLLKKDGQNFVPKKVKSNKLNSISELFNLTTYGDNTLKKAITILNQKPTFEIKDPSSSLVKVVDAANKSVKIYKFINLDSGIYGVDRPLIIKSNLELIYVGNAVEDDLEESQDSVTFDFSDITTSVLDAINTSSNLIEVNASSQNITVFKAVVNNVSESYLYKGGGGSYGSGQPNTMTQDDLELLEQASEPITNITQIKNRSYYDLQNLPTTDDIDEGNANFYNKQADWNQSNSLAPDFIKNKPSAAVYQRVNVSTSRNFLESDNGNTLIITGTVTLTFSGVLPEDFNFNFKVKVGGSLTIANGDKILLDTTETAQTQIVAGAGAFGTVYQFDINTFIAEGI